MRLILVHMVARVFFTITISALFTLPVCAQQRRDQFAKNLPAIGAPLPNVEIFDDRGQVLPTEQLKGNYTVLVFGCMT